MMKPCNHSCDEIISNCKFCEIASTRARYAELWGCPRVIETTEWVDNYKIVSPKGRGGNWQGNFNTQKSAVTVVIPHLDTLDLLEVSLGLWRYSTLRPYFIVIDTGSPWDVCQKLEGFRREDLEIHYLRSGGYCHSSQPVSVAMDLAWSLCNSEYLFSTHVDVFLKNRDFLQKMRNLCSATQPVVGWEMSPRKNTTEWKGCVSHTATMWHMPTCRRAGVWWSLSRWYEEHGGAGASVGWPDTEAGPNWCLRKAGIIPKLLGSESNFKVEERDDFTHARSISSARIYGGHGEVIRYGVTELERAKKRLEEWSTETKATPVAKRELPCIHLGIAKSACVERDCTKLLKKVRHCKDCQSCDLYEP